MATTADRVPLERNSARTSLPADNLRFDYLYALLSGFLIFGLFLDGWAHNNGRVDTTFFTPWHAVLYGSFALIGLLLVITQLRNVMKGHRFDRALPRGYGIALIGVLLFAAAGGGDFIWHEIFGFEANLDILLSPAHLFLATGAFLFLSAPLRAAWNRRTEVNWAQLFPALFALVLLVAVFAFFMQYAYFLNNPEGMIQRRYAGEDIYSVYRLFGIYFHAALYVGVILFVLRRWGRVPVGLGTLTVGLVNALMIWMRWGDVSIYPVLFAAPVIGGLALDCLILWIHPSADHPIRLRLFAFLATIPLFLSFFLVAIATYGITWKIHLWLGSVVIAGIFGLMLSYLVFPPQMSADITE
jgi:hypothetical protein